MGQAEGDDAHAEAAQEGLEPRGNRQGIHAVAGCIEQPDERHGHQPAEHAQDSVEKEFSRMLHLVGGDGEGGKIAEVVP